MLLVRCDSWSPIEVPGSFGLVHDSLDRHSPRDASAGALDHRALACPEQRSAQRRQHRQPIAGRVRVGQVKRFRLFVPWVADQHPRVHGDDIRRDVLRLDQRGLTHERAKPKHWRVGEVAFDQWPETVAVQGTENGLG